MATLSWISKTGEVQSYTLSSSETLIGRDPKCNIVLDDDRISRRHCSIIQIDKSFILQDLGSRNGTRVNDEIISRTVLHNGVKIQLGKLVIEFLSIEDKVEIPSTLGTRWLIPKDWSSIESIVDVSLNPNDTSLIGVDIKLENNRELRNSYDRLKAFYSMSGILSGIRSEKELATKLLEQLFLVLPAEQGFILIQDTQVDALKPVAALSSPGKQVTTGKRKPVQSPSRTIAISHTIIDQVIRDKSAVLTHDATSDNRFAAAESIVKGQLHSAMCAPFLYQDQVIGIIQLATFSKKNAFNEDDLRLLTIIANQAAIWLKNIWLYEAAEHRANEMKSLFDIGKAITSHLSQEKVLDMIMDNSLELVHAQSGYIMLVEERVSENPAEKKKILKMKASAHYGKDMTRVMFNEKLVREIGQGIAGWVAQKGEALLLKEKTMDPGFNDMKKDEDVKDALCVPLFHDDNVIGILSVNNKLGEKTFDQNDLKLLSTFATQAGIAIENAKLYSSLRDMYIHTIKAFANAIEARDPYTGGHCDRLSLYAVTVGQSLGMPMNELEALRGAGLLHDIGKIGIQEEILKKKEALTEEEFQKMKLHPEIGSQILETLSSMKELIPIIYHHQERFDGTGYPGGLKGEEIPIGARIISVVDAFDAMTSTRPYREQMPVEAAIEELRKNVGTQFDPVIVERFIELVIQEKWGVNSLDDSTPLSSSN